MAVNQIRLELIGSFRLTGSDGATIPVTSRKGKALIAVLALSPRMERTRNWLQDLLWSRCERPEAQNSLRRELSNLRKIIAPHAPFLIESDHSSVRLRGDRLHVETEPCDPASGLAVLLEGLDIVGEEAFEEWLRTARSASAGRSRSITGEERQRAVARVGLLPVLVNEADPLSLAEGEWVADRFAAAIMETGLLDVIDYRLGADPEKRSPCTAQAPDAFLSLRVLRRKAATEVSLCVSQIVTGSVLLSRRACYADDGDGWENPALSVFLQEATDQLLRVVINDGGWRDHPTHLAGKHTIDAIDQMFGLGEPDLERAEQNLALACDLSPRSTIFAWRAYRSVFLADQPDKADRDLVLDAIREHSQRALALDPYNGLTLSLLAHLNAFVLRDFEMASAYLDRARSLGSNHVMRYDAESLLHFYTGNLGLARKAAECAEQLGRHLPYRYCFATSLCMIEALSGNLDAAIRHGERALTLQPRSAKKPYLPLLRYLGASYSAAGRYDQARETFGTLRTMEPTESDAILTTNYPTPSDTAAAFVRSGLKSVGM